MITVIIKTPNVTIIERAGVWMEGVRYVDVTDPFVGVETE
jgi:hypothetical protein